MPSGTAQATVASTSATGESPYRLAINATLRVIQRRGRLFRNQIIGVVLLGLAILTAAIALRAAYLTASVWLVPLVGVFFWWDHRLLCRWRSDLLRQWCNRSVDFEAYRAAMLAVPALPPGTLRSMVNTLPRGVSLIEEQLLETPARTLVAQIVERHDRWRAIYLGVRSTLFALSAAAMLSAVATQRAVLWWLAAVVVFVPLAAWLMQRAQRRQIESLVAAAVESMGEARLASSLPISLQGYGKATVNVQSPAASTRPAP